MHTIFISVYLFISWYRWLFVPSYKIIWSSFKKIVQSYPIHHWLIWIRVIDALQRQVRSVVFTAIFWTWKWVKLHVFLMIKDGSLWICSSASFNCYTLRNLFQNGATVMWLGINIIYDLLPWTWQTLKSYEKLIVHLYATKCKRNMCHI